MKWTTKPERNKWYWCWFAGWKIGRDKPVLRLTHPDFLAAQAHSYSHFYGPLVAPDPPPKPIVVEGEVYRKPSIVYGIFPPVTVSHFGIDIGLDEKDCNRLLQMTEDDLTVRVTIEEL